MLVVTGEVGSSKSTSLRSSLPHYHLSNVLSMTIIARTLARSFGSILDRLPVSAFAYFNQMVFSLTLSRNSPGEINMPDTSPSMGEKTSLQSQNIISTHYRPTSFVRYIGLLLAHVGNSDSYHACFFSEDYDGEPFTGVLFFMLDERLVVDDTVFMHLLSEACAGFVNYFPDKRSALNPILKKLWDKRSLMSCHRLQGSDLAFSKDAIDTLLARHKFKMKSARKMSKSFRPHHLNVIWR